MKKRQEIDRNNKTTKMNQIELKAYGKINLSLDITGKREDGYHFVKMILQTVDIADLVTIERTESGIVIESDDSRVPSDERNLAWKAAHRMLSETVWETDPKAGVRIAIKKRIPMEAGMAGGSADAAAVLVGINRLFDLGLSIPALDIPAVRLGADVPFCLRQFEDGACGSNVTWLAEGIGEKLRKLNSMPPCWAVIVKPPFGISTKWAYDEFDTGKGSAAPKTELVLNGLKNGNPEEICKGLGNVLEGPAICAHPEIKAIKKKLTEQGAAGVMMSGSGPAVFGIFTKEEAADTACCAFKGESYDYFKIRFK